MSTAPDAAVTPRASLERWGKIVEAVRANGAAWEEAVADVRAA